MSQTNQEIQDWWDNATPLARARYSVVGVLLGRLAQVELALDCAEMTKMEVPELINHIQSAVEGEFVKPMDAAA